MFEHTSAKAAPVAHAVTSTHTTTAVLVSKEVALLNHGAGSLDTVSQMLNATKSQVDAITAKTVANVASSASTAASASRTLAAIAKAATPGNRAQVSAAAVAGSALKSSLAATSLGANALANAKPGKIKFCTVKFVAFAGFTLVIPGIITILIPPIIIKLRVPCFISGDF